MEFEIEDIAARLQQGNMHLRLCGDTGVHGGELTPMHNNSIQISVRHSERTKRYQRERLALCDNVIRICRTDRRDINAVPAFPFRMRFAIGLLLLAAVCCQEMLVTKEYVDYLKRHVTWEVEEYENNVFRGWTVEDAQSLLGLLPSEIDTSIPMVEEETLPASLSWAGSSCDHSPKNQGACGGCWAFASAGMLSDRCCIMSVDKGWLSPQELISCDKGSMGCSGGSLSSPIKYFQSKGGLVPDACDPYVGQNTQCPTKCNNGGAWATSHVCKCASVVNCYGTSGIQNCLKKGPTTIALSVCQSFMSYKSGVYKCDCTSYIGGHATLAMGYSATPECSYFVKNSWGKYWGINGYFHIGCNTCNLSGGPTCASVSA